MIGLRDMTSNAIHWDTVDVRTCWILRAAVGGEQSESVSLDVLRAITPTAILAIPSVGFIRGKLAWEELQRLLGTPDRAFEQCEDMPLSWETLSRPTRRIVRSALWPVSDAQLSLDSLRTLSLQAICRVPQVGELRGVQAWREVQAVIQRFTMPRDTQTPPKLTLRMESIPAPSKKVLIRDLRDMPSNAIHWDMVDVRTCWILRAAAGGEQSESVLLDVLRAITPTAILTVPSVGFIRGKQAWKELQRLLGTPDRAFESSEGMPLSWKMLSPPTRRIVRTALGSEVDAQFLLDSLRTLSLQAIRRVPSVGEARGMRAWREVQAVIGRFTMPGDIQTPPEFTLGLVSIPALPTDIAARDLVRLEDLDPLDARVVEKVMIQMGCAVPDRLCLRWMTNLDRELLESIKSVGPRRAARFIERIADYVDARARPSSSASALIKALEEASQEAREALDAVVLTSEWVPYAMRDLYERVAAGCAREEFPLRRMLTGSAVQFCEEFDLNGPESDAFVRMRDYYFSHQLIAKAIRTDARAQVVKVAVLLRVAMRSKIRWSSAVWESDAGVASREIVPIARDLLHASGTLKPSGEWSYLEEVEMLDELFSGATLATVGAKRGFTRECVRQRVLRLGYKRNNQRANNRERLVVDDEKIRNDVEDFARRHPGCTPPELSIALGLSIERAARECARLDWLTLPEANQTDPESATPRRLQTAQRSLRALQDAATFVYPVTKTDYDDLKSKGFIQGPSSARMLQIFGSWRQACDDAGVESGKSPRRAGEHLKWSHTELMDVVIRYLLHPAFRGQAEQYRLWKESQPANAELPSFGAIRNNLRIPWNRIKAKALKHARQRWKTDNRSNLPTASNS